jgi:hypothetical protein
MERLTAALAADLVAADLAEMLKEMGPVGEQLPFPMAFAMLRMRLQDVRTCSLGHFVTNFYRRSAQRYGFQAAYRIGLVGGLPAYGKMLPVAPVVITDTGWELLGELARNVEERMRA